MPTLLSFKLGLLISVMSAVGMLTAVACGASEEATATNTPAPIATAISQTGGPVATPTPTRTAVPAATQPPSDKQAIKRNPNGSPQ